MLADSGIFIELAVSLVAGMGTGLLYFGSLWTSLRKLNTQDKPLLSLAIGATFRLGFVIALVLFAIVGGAKAWHILSALLGFLIIRQILIMRTKNRLSTTPHNANG